MVYGIWLAKNKTLKLAANIIELLLYTRRKSSICIYIHIIYEYIIIITSKLCDRFKPGVVYCRVFFSLFLFIYKECDRHHQVLIFTTPEVLGSYDNDIISS